MANLLNTPRLGRFLATGVLAALLAAATACTPLDRLKHAQQDDRGDFRSGLALEYLSFAESEDELGHTDNSRFFAKKGLRASRDEATPPEMPNEWEVETDTLTELRNARKRLMRVRSEFFQRVAGQSLARAQMLYDCWVMQSATHTANDLSLPCRSEFLGELSELEQIINTLGPAPKVTLPAEYTILFPSGGTELDNNAAFTVQEILALTRLFPFYTIDITGHSDRAGSQRRNLVISTERAANVASALVDAGIDPERIGFKADGEDNPAIPTLDGVSRERNRRVEVRVLPLQNEPASTAPAATKATPKDGVMMQRGSKKDDDNAP